jgi:tRNA (cytidine32/uridine32-2'-O)-methyltransferase
MMPLARLSGVRMVLVRTSHPGNIGSAARAMKTMGLSDLALVDPAAFPDPQANALAAGADDLLDAAHCHADSVAAAADCHWVVGATARLRSVELPPLTPREFAAATLTQLAAGRRVAVLFGNERTGLTNDELQRCHAAVHIPTDADFGSLNLAQAVQVLAYELRVAALAAEPAAAPTIETTPPADAKEMEAFFGHLERALEAIDFFKGRPSDTLMRRLRRIFLRAEPTLREVMTLRGILADAERMAQLAGRKKGPE